MWTKCQYQLHPIDNSDAWKQSNVAHHVVKCSATHAAVLKEVAEVSGLVDSSGINVDAVHPIDILLCVSLMHGKVKAMSGRCGTAETPTMCNMRSCTVMLKHSTVNVRVRNDAMLQDLISISDVPQCTCNMHRNLPTTVMDSCQDHDTATSKTVDLLHTVWSMIPSTHTDTCASIST